MKYLWTAFLMYHQNNNTFSGKISSHGHQSFFNLHYFKVEALQIYIYSKEFNLFGNQTIAICIDITLLLTVLELK